MKHLSDLLTSTDPELVEFAKTFEAVAFYTDISSVRLNSLVLGQVARGLNVELESHVNKLGTDYSLMAIVNDRVVEFHCFVPFIRENNKP